MSSKKKISYIRSQMRKQKNPLAKYLFRVEQQIPYDLKEKLGEGGFGSVYKTHTSKNEAVAIKKIKEESSAVREVQILELLKPGRNLPNQYVPYLYDYFKYKDNYYVVLELLSGGDLGAWKKRKTLTMREKQHIFRRCVEALHYIHNRQIVHNDIKPANIIYDPQGGERSVIIDFGLACVSARTPADFQRDVTELSSKTRYTPSQARLATEATECDPRGNGGTYVYFSPERYLQRKGLLVVNDYKEMMQLYKKGDIYALGLTMYSIFTLTDVEKWYDDLPNAADWNEDKLDAADLKKAAQLAVIENGIDSVVPPVYLPHNSVYSELIVEMCSYDQDDRPSTRECLREINERG